MSTTLLSVGHIKSLVTQKLRRSHRSSPKCSLLALPILKCQHLCPLSARSSFLVGFCGKGCITTLYEVGERGITMAIFCINLNYFASHFSLCFLPSLLPIYPFLLKVICFRKHPLGIQITQAICFIRGSDTLFSRCRLMAWGLPIALSIIFLLKHPSWQLGTMQVACSYYLALSLLSGLLRPWHSPEPKRFQIESSGPWELTTLQRPHQRSWWCSG